MAITIHEIDSAYWKEWKQFNKAFGWFDADHEGQNVRNFLLLHIPMLGMMFWGLIAIYQRETSGMIISLLVSAGGVFAFFFHRYFLRRGAVEFSSSVSRGILWVTLVLSTCQAVLTLLMAIR
jgi:hypothetical protein